MDYTILVLFGGLIIGSFLNVVIARIDHLKSIFLTRSECPNCKTKLRWMDLVPVLSFALLRARCRYCQKPISWQYPAVEVGTALTFLLLFITYGLSGYFFYYAVIAAVLIVVSVYDLKTQLIPEEFVWGALALALIGGGYASGYSFWNSILSGAIGGGFLGALVLFSRERWMGAGDIKIGVILGLLLGFPTVLLGLFLSFIIGSVVGLVYIALRKKTMKDALPFAPFLAAGLFLSLLYGSTLMDWYVNALS